MKVRCKKCGKVMDQEDDFKHIREHSEEHYQLFKKLDPEGIEIVRTMAMLFYLAKQKRK